MTESGLEKIVSADKLYAIIARANLSTFGHQFFSKPEDALQVGIIHYEAGYQVKPHYHPPSDHSFARKVEVLHVQSGECLLTLFTEEKAPLAEIRLVHGDTAIIFEGYHALETLSNTKLLEIKQGPYLSPEKDKVFLK